MHKRYIAQRIQYNILIKVMNIYISSATEINIPPKAEFCSEIYYSTFYIVVILLKGNVNSEGEVLKVKIDSFDTKREQSPISHFHGNNLYTTSREHNNFSFFQYV